MARTPITTAKIAELVARDIGDTDLDIASIDTEQMDRVLDLLAPYSDEYDVMFGHCEIFTFVRMAAEGATDHQIARGILGDAGDEIDALVAAFHDSPRGAL